MSETYHEQEQPQGIDRLVELENINSKKLIELEYDVNEQGEQVELGEHEAAYWVEFKNPGTDETVEAKVYMPENGVISNVVIFCPGYAGDIVAQERAYAAELGDEHTACIFLRHNHLKLDTARTDHVHCPQRMELGGKHLGNPDTKFSFSGANKELLTVLMALADNSSIELVNVIGHSWGGRISIFSLMELAKLAKEGNGRAQEIEPKMKRFISLGGWIGDKEDVLALKNYFQEAEKNPPFEGLTWEGIESGLEEAQTMLDGFSELSLPSHVIIHAVSSYRDFDEEGASTRPAKFMKYILRKISLERRGGFVFAQLDESGEHDILAEKPDTYGTQRRGGEFHDYKGAPPVLAAMCRGDYGIQEPSEEEAERLKELSASKP